MDIQKLQELVTLFNKEYFKATETSNQHNYFDAALFGRQIVNFLSDNAVIKDIKPQSNINQ